jgi:nucleotide-binding universal stress UspA family protein
MRERAMERILVGVDGSSAALKAVDLAADLANKYNAELILLTVVPHFSPEVDPALEEYARVEHIQEPATELALAVANTVLDGARRAAQGRGASRIAAEPSVGDPAHEIITAAGDRGADLIVVGSRGHGRLAGLLLGSVAQKVVSLAPCPVVVVR